MFRVGQKVVCVDARPGEHPESGPEQLQERAVYTVSAVDCTDDGRNLPIVQVTELPICEDGWLWAARFRPVVERKTDIAIFQAMLTKTPRELAFTSPERGMTDGITNG